MFSEILERLSSAAIYKASFLRSSKSRYFVASMLAGVYIGVAILFIVLIGGIMQTPQGGHKILMGMSFGISISLVIMTGAELFTGNNMVMLAGYLDKNAPIKINDMLLIWLLCYFGNFAGSIVVGTLFAYSGAYDTHDFLISLAVSKTTPVAPLVLFVKGILCNLFTCLAVLCSLKMKSEFAKLVMIFWCLFGFTTSGYENSIANMAMFTAAYILPNSTLTLYQIFYNLVLTTLGNMTGGVMLGLTYYYLGNKPNT